MTWWPILKCARMVGVAQNIIILIGNSMANFEDSVDINQEALGTVDMKRRIFQGDSLPPLLFVIIMIPLSMVLRDTKAGYQLKKGGCKINHLLFMDDLKLYGKNSDQIDSLVQIVWSYSEDIGMKYGIDKGVVLDNVARKGHWELCKKHGLERSDRWYEHTPSDVMENDEVELYWDLTIQRDMTVTHNRPDKRQYGNGQWMILLFQVTSM